MSIAVLYIYWSDADAQNFANSWRANPPGQEHVLLVICNDGQVTDQKKAVFDGIPCVLLPGDNIGQDIGAYLCTSDVLDQDLMVGFGSTSYVRGPNWLKRMAESFARHGPGLYGTMQHTGVVSAKVFPHIRTTAFWLPPRLLREYPFDVIRPEQRYPFEHGRLCLTSWILEMKLRVWVVTWNDEYPYPHWQVPNGFHNGDQSQLIAGDRLSRPPYYHVA